MKQSQKRWLSSTLLLPILLWLIILPVNTLANDNKNNLQYYLKHYGGYADSQDKLVRRVSKVFERVSSVADKRHYRLPQLAVIKGFDDPREPLVFALPDGSVVLFKRALDLIYKDVSPEYGDTRAAFVLGHELAHLANDGFWHREFLTLAEGSPVLQELVESYRNNNGKEKESKSDDRGFIYAAMAGYPVNKLVGEEQNFFKYWEQQTFRTANETHPQPEERAAALEKRLKELLDILPYFHFGVRLSHFGRCDKAVDFLKEFLKHFPAREVYNSLGICELQQARKSLGKKADHYWLPTMLDIVTRLETQFTILSVPNKDESEKKANEFLTRAKKYFKLALEMDSFYVPAYINLASTRLYLDEIYEARAAIEKAYKLAPKNLDIQCLRTIILYEEGKRWPYVQEMKPHAIQAGLYDYVREYLDKLSASSNAPLSVVYNTAQLLRTMNKDGYDMLWLELSQRAIELPERIRNIVCKNSKCLQLPKQEPRQNWNSLDSNSLGKLLGTSNHLKLNQDDWKKSRLKRLYAFKETIYQSDIAEILKLGKQIEMVVLKKLDHIKHLPDYCGQPLRQRTLPNGILWSCGDNWAALEIDEKVKEVWVVK